MLGHLIRNSNILFYSDNTVVTAILNSQSSKDKLLMFIVRPLVLTLVANNINLRSEHITGMLNFLPDHISRFQVTPALLQKHNMGPPPTPMPTHLRKLHSRMMEDIASSLSKSTQGQYSKSWSTFTSFCRHVLSIRHLPATSQSVSLYVTHLHQQYPGGQTPKFGSTRHGLL